MAGDREAFSELAANQWRRLLAVARSVVANLNAEDVVQDGLIKAWHKLPSLRDPAAFSAWLTRIVVTTALDSVRRARTEVELDESMLSISVDDRLDEHVDVVRMLTRLAPRQRAILHLTTFEGMTDSEIGSALGISASSVRVHRMRARTRLTEMFREVNSE